MRGPYELFLETSASLQFPTYFDFNWDALEECLNDIEWLADDDQLAIVILKAHLVLTNEPEAIGILRQIIEGISEHRTFSSTKGAMPIFILQSNQLARPILGRFARDDYARRGKVTRELGWVTRALNC